MTLLTHGHELATSQQTSGVSLGLLLSMMASPPNFNPVVGVRTVRQEMGDEGNPFFSRTYHSQAEVKARYLAVLSTRRWLSAEQIAKALTITKPSAAKVMSRPYMQALTTCRSIKCNGGHRLVWKLKPSRARHPSR